jgi:hypothetical protein
MKLRKLWSVGNRLKDTELLQFTYSKIANPPIDQFFMIAVDSFLLQPICKLVMRSNISESTEVSIMKNNYFIVFAELDVKLSKIRTMNARNDGLTCVFWEH